MRKKFIAFPWHYRLSLVVQIILSSTLLFLSSFSPHTYIYCKLTLLYIFYLMLTSLMWFASSSMSPYNEWIYFCWEDRKGKFVFFSCHTINSSITFMDVHSKKLFLSLPFAIFLSSIHSLLLSLQSLSLTRFNVCTFPIFYCHRFVYTLCCVPLAYLLILFGSFFRKLNEFCVIRLI